ncbi:rhomboid family intramembrane serine protease [Myxococcaceae bacterium GXIMD 01537]
MARERRVLDELPPPSEPGPASPPPPKPPQRRPWVCIFIIAASVAMFLSDRFLLQQVVAPDGRVLGALQPLALYGPLVREGQYWRLLGAAIEHGGALHLLFNMSVVWTLGFTLERALGSGRFLLLSLVTALGASAFSLIFDFNVPTVGASGMILGWAGAMMPIITRQGQRELGIWLVQVAVISLLPGVSWAGHLGGFLFGVACGLALRMGGAVYTRAAPLLLAIAAGVAFIAAHPSRPGGP